MVWKLAAADCSAIASVSSRMSGGGGSAAGFASIPAIMASMSDWFMVADGAGGGGAGRGGGGAMRDGSVGGRGVAAEAGAGAGLGGALLGSSSAMMRRMEARISSIEGSCAFAGWLMPCPRSPHDAAGIPAPASNCSHVHYLAGSAQVWHAVRRTQSTHVDRLEPRRTLQRRPARVIFRPAFARRPSCRAPGDSAPADRRLAR